MSREGQTLTTIALIFFGLFITFTVIVGLSLFSTIDIQSTVYLQNIVPHFLDLPFSFLSFLGSFEVTFAVLVAIIVTKYAKNSRQAIYTIIAFLIGTIAELSGKLYLFHPSPPKLFFRHVDILFPTTYVHTNYSYPSGHMFRTTFLIVLFIYYLSGSKKKIYPIILLIVILFLMASSRIYLGEHWLSDVIGGILLGTFFGITLINVVNRTN